jgi:Cu+-exporting ATPase
MPNPSQSATGTLAKDPVCGMNVNPATAKHRAKHAGKTYYFCCGHCAQKFQVDPEKYLAEPKSAGLVTLGTPGKTPTKATPEGPRATLEKIKDPVCGMDVDPATARYKIDQAGTPYYFCSGHCREKFRADPAHYTSQKTPGSTPMIQIGAAKPRAGERR